MSRYLIPRLRDVLFLAILAAALALAPRMMNVENELHTLEEMSYYAS
jgi:hypothetical protein